MFNGVLIFFRLKFFIFFLEFFRIFSFVTHTPFVRCLCPIFRMFHRKPPLSLFFLQYLLSKNTEAFLNLCQSFLLYPRQISKSRAACALKMAVKGFHFLSLPFFIFLHFKQNVDLQKFYCAKVSRITSVADAPPGLITDFSAFSVMYASTSCALE